MSDKTAAMPTAVVAEVYESRYTIEWVSGPMPLGTNLYAGPKVVKAWAEEAVDDAVCDASLTVTHVQAPSTSHSMSKYQALIDAPSLHDQIMNLPCVEANMEPRGTAARLAYKVGHRDARHAAAELAQAQDDAIRSLLADLERAEKDAERYRWLAKEHGWWLLKHFPAQRPYIDHMEVIDAAIDAALSQAGQGGQGEVVSETDIADAARATGFVTYGQARAIARVVNTLLQNGRDAAMLKASEEGDQDGL